MHAVSAIRTEALACVRAGRTIFRGISFSVAAGSLLAVEGPNGAGKTSLLRVIAGFIPPAEGKVVLRTSGEDIAETEERGKVIGWLGHLDGAKAQLTPREVLTFFARLYGSQASIEATIDEVGLARGAGELPCQYLSAGQKKRLALARLKLTARSIWLLDEPLAALDEEGKSLALHLVRQHCESGGIAIMASHDAIAPEAARLRLGA